MNDLAKLTITKDSFIYSVNQAYEARIRNDGHFNSHLKYEPFLEKTWTLATNPDIHSLKKTLGEIVEHHFLKVPNYRREEAVNIENISWFSHSIAALFADIEYLVLAYTGHTLPALSAPKIPHTNSSKNIILAIKKYTEFKVSAAHENRVVSPAGALESAEQPREKFSLFPLLSEENINVEEVYIQEIWSLIFYYIKKFFGAYADLISLYATWKYVIKTNSSDVVDWNIRPPAGDLYRKQFKHLFEKDYFKNNSNKQGFNGKENGFKGKGNDFQNKEASSKPLNNKPTEIVEKPFEVDKYPKKRQFQDRQERPFRSDRSERHNQQNQDEIIEKALLEVSIAVKKMQQNPTLEEISLSPQNSFIRRQQHVVISEGGFETESRGEAENRHVCVKRK